MTEAPPPWIGLPDLRTNAPATQGVEEPIADDTASHGTEQQDEVDRPVDGIRPTVNPRSTPRATWAMPTIVGRASSPGWSRTTSHTIEAAHGNADGSMMLFDLDTLAPTRQLDMTA